MTVYKFKNKICAFQKADNAFVQKDKKDGCPSFFCFVSFVVVADKVFALFAESFD